MAVNPWLMMGFLTTAATRSLILGELSLLRAPALSLPFFLTGGSCGWPNQRWLTVIPGPRQESQPAGGDKTETRGRQGTRWDHGKWQEGINGTDYHIQ